MPPTPRAPSASLHPVSLLRALRARPRLLGGIATGIVVFAITRRLEFAEGGTAALLGWNTGALLYLAFAWRYMAKADVQGLRDAAPAQDEGRVTILLLVVLAAIAVLVAVGTQMARIREFDGLEQTLHLGLAGLTVVTSWLFTQVLFAQHYAHDFYLARVRNETDPLHFPGTPDPLYGDFFHFACVIGAAAQTADISFQGSTLRPVGTLHCVLAFFFNAALLALSINMAAGALG